MSISKKKQTYPPSIADCPDYYSLDATGSCKIGTNIEASQTTCNVENFKQDVKYTPLRSPASTAPSTSPSMSPTPYPLNIPPPPPIQIVKEIVIDCRQVHKHSSDCPVCSKIYRSNYSIFMVIIVILVLIILFLSKKCMNI
jgi:hypothetical protein